MPDKESFPERKQTDESLRGEREKADRALAEKLVVAEGDADVVVDRARDAADAVLSAARDKADETAAVAEPAVDVARERRHEDDVLRSERAAADESLQRERDESARALSGLVPLERDKTDRYLLTERSRSDRDLSNRDDFLAIVSHDLRNLLGGIVLSASLLARNAAESEEGEQTLQGTKRIQRYAARMNRLIGDLVDVASIEAGKLALNPAPGDARALLAEAVDLFQAAASAKGISLVSEMDGPAPAEFDHDRMLQVLANLITNAIKFTPSGGAIRIGGERVGAELRFVVTDTGAGIPAHMLEAVFERFWQVDEKDTRGVGLGLYISRCVVEAHGGEIRAESELGKGTNIRFTLPGGRGSA